VYPTWLSIALSPTEWAPPLPDNALAVGDKSSAKMSFPLRVFFPERGWPATIEVPTVFAYLGRAGDAYQLSRTGELDVSVRSSSGGGTITGKLTALGTYDIDGMGRLTACDVSWIARLRAKAPQSLGGLRTVEYVVSAKWKLVEVGGTSGK
jgi:hypothetical protein